METVISFVDSKTTVADVGTDHGFIPIELVRRGLAAGAVAMDVRQGPLKQAREHIRQHGLEEKIETRLGDGVEKLKPGEADTVVIAGMGGQVMIHILENGRHLWRSVRHWILSPQSELDKVRRFLHRNGFDITKEKMVEDEGKYYTVMDVVFGGDRKGPREELTQIQYLYGPRLIENRDQVLMEFLGREVRQLAQIAKKLQGEPGDRAQARRENLERHIADIRQVIKISEER